MSRVFGVATVQACGQWCHADDEIAGLPEFDVGIFFDGVGTAEVDGRAFVSRVDVQKARGPSI